jgi:hypothetical protein
MSVSDLAHEAAKRYCDAVPVRDYVVVALERNGMASAAREPAHVDALTQSWRRVMEEQMVQYFNVAELTAMARLYATPESQSLMRKMVPFTVLITPMLEAEVYAWARRVTSASEIGGGPAPGPVGAVTAPEEPR